MNPLQEVRLHSLYVDNHCCCYQYINSAATPAFAICIAIS